VQETYFLGGYYLIAGTRRQTWMNSSLLPAKLYSISTHISQHHPSDSPFTWADGDEQRLYSLRLGLDSKQRQILQTQADKWFDRG